MLSLLWGAFIPPTKDTIFRSLPIQLESLRGEFPTRTTGYIEPVLLSQTPHPSLERGHWAGSLCTSLQRKSSSALHWFSSYMLITITLFFLYWSVLNPNVWGFVQNRLSKTLGFSLSSAACRFTHVLETEGHPPILCRGFLTLMA